MRRTILAIIAALATIAFSLAVPGSASAAPDHAPAGTASALVNFNSSGQQIVRFDTNGNAVDAHDGQLARFGDTELMQTFTAGRTGTLAQVRFTAFQEATPAWTGQPPNAPLTLELATLTAPGGIGQVLATQSFATTTVGWTARNLMMTPAVSASSWHRCRPSIQIRQDTRPTADQAQLT